MVKFYLILICLFSFKTTTAQRFKQAYLINEKTDKPVSFYPIRLPKNQMIYSDLNGLFYYPKNTVLEFRYPLFQYLKINSENLGSVLYLRERKMGLEELVIYKGESIPVNPFYKKVFKDRKGIVQTMAVGTKSELLSKVIFNEKYYNRKVKTVTFRLMNETDEYKNADSYIRLNVYNINKKLIYSSNPIKIDASKTIEVNHELESDVFIDLIGMYFGIEIIGLINQDGGFHPTGRPYLNVSMFNKNFDDYQAEHFMHIVTDPSFYRINNPNNYRYLKIFGFDLQ